MMLDTCTLAVLTDKQGAGNPGINVPGRHQGQHFAFTAGEPEPGQLVAGAAARPAGPARAPAAAGTRSGEPWSNTHGDAVTYYRARGWDVERVSDTKTVLDLRLVRPGSGEVRHVKVKGRAQAASRIEVTRAVVAMSRQEPCYLLVLDKIHYEDTGPGPDDYDCWGGRRRSGNWCAYDKDLEAKTSDLSPSH